MFFDSENQTEPNRNTTMKQTILAAMLLTLSEAATLSSAQEPQMPPPAKEHEWLQKFVGEWNTSSEIYMDPTKEPMKATGTETCRTIGGFWILGEAKCEMMGKSMTSQLTLGYDPAKGKYVGTWIDSMNSYLWVYTGTLDESGKVLTLETEGHCPMEPGKMRKFKEVTEFKSDDHRVFTSSMQGDDGKWTAIVKVEAKRKK